MNTLVPLLAVFLLLLTGCMVSGGNAYDSVDPRGEQLLVAGVNALRQGDLEMADAHFEVVLEMGQRAEALDGRGCVALLKGHGQEAEAYFLKALAIDPNYVGALGNLALLYEMAGKRNEALTLYRGALKKAPYSPTLRNNFAAAIYDFTHIGPERFGRAIREMRKAAALAAHPLIIGNLEKLEER